MKVWHVAFALVCLAGSFWLGSLTQAPVAAQAQPLPMPVSAPPRFQVSAFAASQPGGVFHGCYTVDTITGELWLTVPDKAPTKVSEALRK